MHMHTPKVYNTSDQARARDESDSGDSSLVTPAAKRPKSALLIADAMDATPPPVVGQQTVSKLFMDLFGQNVYTVQCIWFEIVQMYTFPPLSEIQHMPFFLAKAKKMAAGKANKVHGDEMDSGERMRKFGEYDLVALDLPFDARPFTGGNHLGRHGYTLYSKTGADLRLQYSSSSIQYLQYLRL